MNHKPSFKRATNGLRQEVCRLVFKLRKIDFGLSCMICKNTKKTIVVHHYSYDKDSIVHTKYYTDKDDWEGQLAYLVNLISEIKRHPCNFAVYCLKCHNEVHKWIDLDPDTIGFHFNGIFNENKKISSLKVQEDESGMIDWKTKKKKQNANKEYWHYRRLLKEIMNTAKARGLSIKAYYHLLN